MATNNPILTDYNTMEQINQENDLTAIEVQRGIGSYFPIFVSLGITLYGFFLFLQTIVDTQYVIYGTLAFLGVLLIYIEHHRAGLIADFLGSTLEKLINSLATIPSIGLAVGMAITVLFIALDTWGAMQSADSIERMLVDGIVKHSEQYKIENAKAKSGVNEAKEYQTQLKEWRTSKSEHYAGCNQSWRVPTYRTKNQQCKDKFLEAKPTAVTSSGGTIAISTYNSMEEKAKEEVAGYRKMFFWVFLGFSILLNYFAMATLFNQYRKKRKELTPEIIDELTDRMELMNAEKINKISMSTKAQKTKLEEKNIIDVEIEKETYNIVIAKRAKALTRKREIPMKIMNNENIMEQQKAGFVFNPFNQAVTTDSDPLNESVKRSRYNGATEKEPNTTKPFNESVITEQTRTMKFGAFSGHELELINILWDNGNVKQNEPLISRDTVLETIGDNKHNTLALRDLYKKLIKEGYAFRKIGYFAKVELGE